MNWSDKDHAFVATHGKLGVNSKITSLENGAISAGSTDAVAGNQLYYIGKNVAAYFGGGSGIRMVNGVLRPSRLRVLQKMAQQKIRIILMWHLLFWSW
ncbi:hypothetical protein [Candidatus Bartonella washoeensis]|uniref:hypothetical protein n=1 Tax=Candidatus Bartonella washoeensis TaxID=186739 RepID=UPI000DE58CF9|nr:hypothetical protein [Bartonella washoeensis]